MSNLIKDIHILAVEDDEIDFMTLTRACKKCGLDLTIDRADRVSVAKTMLNSNDYHCVLLDYRLPDGTGLDLLKDLDNLELNFKPAVIMLTGEDDVSIAVEAMKMGAEDYIAKKTIRPDILEISIGKAIEAISLTKQLKEYQDKVEELAFYDTLTGLPNRYVFNDRLQQLIRLCKRTGQTFIVGMMDLNGFKSINDTYGHQAGDAVLQEVAARLASVVREGDTIARYGGDEFLLLLPENEMRLDMEAFSQRVFNALAEPISLSADEVSAATSIGYSRFPDHGENSDKLIKYADEALYSAKENKNGIKWKFAS